MKKTLLISLSILISIVSINAQSFKKLFKESLAFLEVNDYDAALPILMNMLELQPNNSNTNFSIGNCYMNSTYQKAKAIPYYEQAMEKITIDYRVGFHREKNAPLDVIQLLGQAYHQNYEFDKAAEKFELFKQFIHERNVDDLRKINKKLRISKYAEQQKLNPKDITIQRVEGINTKFAEYRPKLDADENIMFFTSRRNNGSNNMLDDDGKYYEDIYMSIKHNDVWGEPMLIQDNINSQGHDACLYLSPDGEFMYLYRFNTDNDEGILGGGIYKSIKEGNHWLKPELLESSVNSEYWETDASLGPHGNTIFFTSDREGGYGDRDIWMMKKLPNGDWGEAQNLGDNINTAFDEEGPYMHPDGKTLYFSSMGHKVMGGYDFFKSSLKEDGSWSTPENLGYPLNTVGDDLFFFPSVDGKRAYFSSFREGGLGEQDIYVMSLAVEEEKDLAVYKGVVKDTLGNVVTDLVISIFDSELKNKYGIYRPNELTGRFLFILQAGQDYEILYNLNDLSTRDRVSVPIDHSGVTDYTKVVTVREDTITLSEGIVVDNDIIAIAMLDDMNDLEITSMDTDLANTNTIIKEDPKEEVVIKEDPKEEVVIKEDPKEEVVIKEDPKEEKVEFKGNAELPNVYFKSGTSALISSSVKDIETVFNFMNNNKTVRLRISGHTDTQGEAGYNKILSLVRANAIKTFLVLKGIDANKIITTGLGESKILEKDIQADGSDKPKARQMNRRVEFTVIK
jgi:outer membrane protein OmpA-like peptidoglycan-associated protein/tetratricopeptide (TPR) repeat protein